MRFVLATLVLFVFTSLPSVSQQPVDAATKEDVEQTLELTGVRDQMHSIFAALAQSRAKLAAAEYERKNPQASPAEVEKVEIATRHSYEAAFNSLDMDEVIDTLVPIYQRHFTHADLLAMNEFYASPVGQKVRQNSPAIMVESMEAGRTMMQKHLAECQAAVETTARAAVQSGERVNPGDTSGTANVSMTGAAERLRISPAMSASLQLSQVQPEYPPLARQARIQGAVVLDANIGKDGAVESLTVVSGHPMLVPAAMAAVKQWRYKPFTINEVPALVLTQITVNFSLQ